MSITKSHKIFFAIPFDSASKNLYYGVGQKITKQYPNLTTVIGNQEVGPSPAYSDIASFKAQNRELTSQFISQIRAADVIVADLTHNNPNVHVELGIALLENKNILRVTGRSVSELGFDIRNLEVHRYANENELIKKITSYLDTFFKIKGLSISKRHGPLYRRESTPVRITAFKKGLAAHWNPPRSYVIRDGGIRVSFEILKAQRPTDWFGVFFRAAVSPLMGSHLVYVRQNGGIDLAIYPGPRVLESTNTGKEISGIQQLLIQFENERLDVRLGRTRLRSDKLVHQAVGLVLPAAWNANVDVHSVEMICRDTLEPNF